MTTIKNGPAVVGWEVTRGDTWVLPLVKTNEPVSMDGWGWVAQIRASRSRSSTLVTWLSADTSAANTGTVIFSVAANDTDAIVAGDYWFEIERTIVNARTTILSGPLHVLEDVSYD
jgi:hypothetical protein